MSEKSQQKFMGPWGVISIFANISLGSGPMLMPQVYAKAGWLLSTVWLAFVAFESFCSAQYILEAQSLFNAIQYMNKLLLEDDKTDQSQSDVSESNQINASAELLLDEKKKLIASKLEGQDIQFLFSLRETLEFANMGEYLFGKVGLYLNSSFIFLASGLTLVVKSIIIGQLLSELLHSVPVLNNYYFDMTLFLVTCSVLALRYDVCSIMHRTQAGLAKIQTGAAIFRLFVVVTLFTGCFIIMAQDGAQPFKPVFQLSKFADFYGISAFCFSSSHYVPQITQQMRPESKTKITLAASFFLMYVTLLTICIISLLAFGDELQHLEKPYLSTIFENKIEWVYYIVSTYMFLNVIGQPASVMVVRGNLMKIVRPKAYQKALLSKKITLSTYMFQGAITVTTYILAIFLRNFVTLVLDVIGGVAGLSLLYIIPGVSLLKMRSKFEKEMMPLDFDFVHRSTFHHKIFVYFSISIGIILTPYTLYLKIVELMDE